MGGDKRVESMMSRVLALALFAAAVLAQEEILSDLAAAETTKSDAAVTPEQTEGGISQRLNQDAGSEAGAQTADGAQQGKDMVCVCKRIKKPANVKCNRTVEIEEPPQDPKTLKELVQCTPASDLNSPTFFTPPTPVEPMECYDRCHDNQCKPIWKNPAQGWEDWYACVQQCVSGCYIIQ